MNLYDLIAEVRPVDTVSIFTLSVENVPGYPLLIWGRGEAAVTAFERIAEKLAYGSALIIFDIAPAPPYEQPDRAEEIARANDFRTWNPGSKPPGGRLWVKSDFFNGDTNGTHRPYLHEAIKRTTGPVLELGSGPSSTPYLHEWCGELGRKLVTLESSLEWFEKVTHFESENHHLYCADIVSSPFLNLEWGVVFVDHAPGRTRGEVMEIVRNRCDYTVLHDSEELGYGLEPLLATFRYRKDFRRARPWTTIVSERFPIWEQD